MSLHQRWGYLRSGDPVPERSNTFRQTRQIIDFLVDDDVLSELLLFLQKEIAAVKIVSNNTFSDTQSTDHSQRRKQLIQLLISMPWDQGSLLIRQEFKMVMQCLTSPTSRKRRRASSFTLFDQEQPKETLASQWSTTCKSQDLYPLDRHKQAFITLFQYTQRHGHPMQPLELRHVDPKRVTDAADIQVVDMLIGKLETPSESEPLMEKIWIQCQLQSLQLLRDQAPGWRSILKMMVQFADLWVNQLSDAGAIQYFGEMIAREALFMDLYHHTLKLVNIYNNLGEVLVTSSTIKKLCSLLLATMDHISDANELCRYRDRAFALDAVATDPTEPLFGSVDYWCNDFYFQLTKVCNQLVQTDNDTIFSLDDTELPISSEALHMLVKLSFMWPFQVLKKLVSACFENRNQHLIIVPILAGMQRLSGLKKQSSRPSLMVLVLQHLYNSLDSTLLTAFKPNILSFLQASCQPDPTKSCPIMLVSDRRIEANLGLVLDIREYLSACIVPSLEIGVNIEQHTSKSRNQLKLHLQTLQALGNLNDDGLEKARKTYSDHSDYWPIMLAMRPTDVLDALLSLLTLRESGNVEHQLYSLEDWNAIRSCINTLVYVTRSMMGSEVAPDKDRQDEVPSLTTKKESLRNEMVTFMLERLSQYAWPIRVVCYDIYTLFLPLPPKIRIPRFLVQVTGTLNGVFEELSSDDDTPDSHGDGQEGWCLFVQACKLSRTLMKELFRQKESWMSSLVLLWKHPNEDTILTPCFYRNLYPSHTPSVQSEYQLLLDTFLGDLYESMNDAQIIRNYSYPVSQMCPMARRLTDSVLYVIRLLTQCASSLKMAETEAPENPSSSMYADANFFVSNLIRCLQNLKEWTGISASRHLIPQSDKKPFSAKLIREYLRENYSNIQKSEIIEDRQTETQEHGSVVEIFYPFPNEAWHSGRSLAILTFCMLCYVSHQLQRTELQDLVRVLMLQIVEGLTDQEHRQAFRRICSQQVKSRTTQWKKAKERKSKLVLRPIMASDEEILIRSYVSLLSSVEEQRAILQAFEIAESHPPQSAAIYLMPQECRFLAT
ncbi:uncharacterized protein BYT42DRAFT_548371 [Radiomyces spectabilis]|uniref:uncharacterized protein n=1 Tax=Radiomyces spectabilis TaxID=64574 RepID=UPI00221EDDC9|nr:uncharacterized protein BYT42DRAFT_548371 [Radiomyces spectabilis]KAI8371521.1 hypothetical protein BYT42DRAFT_548371 [Radiomyces spectabilis]